MSATSALAVVEPPSELEDHGHVPRILTVASGKGGVGKTHLAVNLAEAIARAGKRVLLVDGDLGLANVNVLLGLAPDKNASHFLEGGEPFESVVTSYEGRFDVLPAGSAIVQLADLDVGGQVKFMKALTSHARPYDLVVIDAGAGIGSNVRFTLAIADEVLVVMNPEATSLTDAYALVKVAGISNIEARFGLVVNRVRSAEEARGMHSHLIKATREFLGTEIGFHGHVYFDNVVGRALTEQRPFVTTFPDSPASRCVEALARRLSD